MTRPYGLPDLVIYGFMRYGVAKRLILLSD